MKTPAFVSMAALVAISGMVSGCVRTYKGVKPQHIGGYGETQKVPLAAELRITDEFRNTTWESEFMGSGTRIPFGEHLAANAEDCARAVFQTVSVNSNGVDAPVMAGANAVVIPRLVYVDITRLLSWTQCNMTMALEWSVCDTSNRLVWVNSFRAERKGVPEGVKGSKKKTQAWFNAVIGDLYQKSAQAMLASRELREYAARTRNANTR